MQRFDFYNYFKSKSDISIESMARFAQDWSTVTSSFLPGDSAVNRLLRLSYAFLSMQFKDNPTIHLINSHDREELINRTIEDLNQYLTVLFR